jgi:hypothetical protein
MNLHDIANAMAALIDKAFVELKAELKLTDAADAALLKGRNACIDIAARALDKATEGKNA